jgi:acetoin utilization deacetylase AcuC-like enzyme
VIKSVATNGELTQILLRTLKDIHAGNGTSDCVDDEPGILFISLHCEDIYPFDADHPPSLLDTADNIHNLGFEVGASRSQYQRLFDAKTIPLIEQQKPQLIMVSAGFDAHEEDQTNACSLNYKV